MSTEHNCISFNYHIKTGHIEKYEATYDYYMVNMINPKDEVVSVIIYKCPWCGAKLMEDIPL